MHPDQQQMLQINFHLYPLYPKGRGNEQQYNFYYHMINNTIDLQ